VNLKFKGGMLKDEIWYEFYNESGILILRTRNKQEARKLMENNLVEFVKGEVVKHPEVDSFWTGVILQFRIKGELDWIGLKH
jgi:hypothetical protein